jgi:hypothetical protein
LSQCETQQLNTGCVVVYNLKVFITLFTGQYS